MLYIIFSVLLAYLFGSINFAVIISNIFIKKDVRNFGSGNAGATNVLRTAGLVPGILTFLFDALKGFVACYCGKMAALNLVQLEFDIAKDELSVYLAFACGVACMLGHVFPVFFHFKGGKGAAVAVGIYSVCCPLAIAIGLACFIVVLLLSKIVSLSSLSATFAVVISSVLFYNKFANLLPQVVLSSLMGLIVILKHKDNIKRLIAKSEKKISIGRK